MSENKTEIPPVTLEVEDCFISHSEAKEELEKDSKEVKEDG